MKHVMPAASDLDFLSGGGEMGERIRNFDWASTPLGVPENWDPSLKTCVRIMLTSQQPIWLGWGNDLIKLYNDPYKAIVGGKHPGALGQPASVVWKDIWKDIAPMLETVMTKNEGTYVESQLLIMERYGYPEETYYTFSYSPVPGSDGRTAGMICYNTAETQRIINERALDTLRRLGAEIQKESTDDVLRSSVAILAANGKDFPFAIVSRVDDSKKKASIFATAGIGDTGDWMPAETDLQHPAADSGHLAQAVSANQLVLFHGNDRNAGLPKGSWDRAPKDFVHVPIRAGNSKSAFAVLTLALNPYRKFDDAYRNFVQLVADQLSLEINNVMAFEEERRRAEALAAIDKAKTVFFSNISHEFRTPLTLMLGPMEELLRGSEAFTEQDRHAIETAHRNALRLLKLVNSLLDFSRIEAGKQQAFFSKVNIAELTRLLAGNFSSVMEDGGLGFEIHTGHFDQPVYVDTAMWEKIVFNLLSNAFKYTLQGKITVDIRQENGYAVLTVTDTGTGIPEKELPHLFERFHRVENSLGRSFEGTGIGLSLVKELVQLHHGSILVESEQGSGSCFKVLIPLGKAHIPADRIVDDAVYPREDVYVDGAVFSHPVTDTPEIPAGDKEKPLVLIVDDNADMREHIASIISRRFSVVTAVNGMDALHKIREQEPELIISDVMMPVMDGLGLLKEIKKDKRTSHTPFILLTARAGEESRIEGWETGADDYLVKPFSANELLARISAHINLRRLRRANEESIRNLFRQTPVGIAVYSGENLVIDMVNDTMLGYWGRTMEQAIGTPLWQLLPEARAQGFDKVAEEVYRTGKRYMVSDVPVVIHRGGKDELIYTTFGFEPRFDEHGQVIGLLGIANDVTDHVVGRKQVEDSERQLKELANAMPQLVWITDADGVPVYFNERMSEFYGGGRNPDGTLQWRPVVHPDDELATLTAWQRAVQTGTPYEREHRLQLKDGSYQWFLSRGYPQKDSNGKVIKWFGTATNIDTHKSFSRELEQKVHERTEQLNSAREKLESKNAELEHQNEELASFSYVASHDLQEPLRKIQTFSNRIQELEKDKLSDTGKDYFNRMVAAAKRMHALIEALLDYSRANTSDRTFVTTDTNLLLQEARSNLSVSIEEKKAVIEAGHLPVINVIPHQFQQLFTNIIGNSLKYSKTDVPPHIRISAEMVPAADIKNNTGYKAARYWRFRFTDNGIGFDPKYQSKIFELFQRLHGRMEYSGTGIGLAICKKIVQNHNGYITATGEPGVGATFDVYVPAEE